VTILERTTFEMSRASEYFDVAELQKMTGLTQARFGEVVIKELMDNALDACESAGVAPNIPLHAEEIDEDTVYIVVEDNGNGIPPDTVRRILNFHTRTSEKAVYRAPTRGLQGNALKTVLGMPFALGVDQPVVVEAHGVKHIIKAWTDPAGELHIDHQEVAGRSEGTLAGVALPKRSQSLKASWWGRAFALFNPHSSVQIGSLGDGSYHANNGHHDIEDLYQNIHLPTQQFPGGWRKFLPTDFTSAWWYDPDAFKRIVFSHITAAVAGGRDLTLRDFVRQFRGLTRTGTAKEVCAHFPSIARLSGFNDHPEWLDSLLAVMRDYAKPPSPSVLGLIGANHFRTSFDAWFGVKRFWYSKETGMDGPIPFAIEVAIAETGERGGVFYGSNFSPTFDVPIQRALEHKDIQTFGVDSFLAECFAYPKYHGDGALAVAFHITAPVLETLDRGKTRIHVTEEMAAAISKALWGAAKDLYREGKAREKDAAKVERTLDKAVRAVEKQERQDRVSVKDAVFEVIPEAFAAASGDGQYPVSVRTLFYQVRPRVQEYNTGRDLDWNYFSQDLVQQYQRLYGSLSGLYYEPRGTLYEPHSDNKLELGTREVADYKFPAWTFNKILYVEKQGLWPVLQQAQLGQRYDMAIVAGQGYATESCRALFARAGEGKYQLFVLHDADPAGYNIARTMREETKRMPGYQVDVIDMGLTVEDAVDMGLDRETFTRKRALPSALDLNDLEAEWFGGQHQGRNGWICQRVELNAMTAPQLVTYIEAALERHGATAKVVPPPEVIRNETANQCWAALVVLARQEIESILDADAIADGLSPNLTDALKDVGPAELKEALSGEPVLSWREALRRKVHTELSNQRTQLRESIQEVIVGAVQDHQKNGVDDSGINAHE